MRVYKDVIRLAQLCMVARLFSSFQSTRFWKLVFYSNKFPFLNMLLINSMPLICLIYKMAKKLKTKVRIHFFCFLTFSSFGLKFIWKRGIGHVGHHQWQWENPSHFPHAPFLPTSFFGQHANIFWQIYFPPTLDNMQTYFGKYYVYFPSSFWTTCKYIWASTIFSIFLLDKMKIFFADIFPPALDNMQIYFNFLGQQANRCLHFGCFMQKLRLCRKPSYPQIKKWL